MGFSGAADELLEEFSRIADSEEQREAGKRAQ